jgi:hypothetical protein
VVNGVVVVTKTVLRGAVELRVGEVSPCSLVDILQVIQIRHIIVRPHGIEPLHEEFAVFGVDAFEEGGIALLDWQFL